MTIVYPRLPPGRTSKKRQLAQRDARPGLLRGVRLQPPSRWERDRIAGRARRFRLVFSRSVATIGHFAIACVGARALRRSGESSLRTLATLSVLSFLPDIDVLGRYRAPRDAIWAHRGATHSLVVAVLAAAMATRLHGSRRWRTFACVAAIVAVSHGCLDAMTDGGRGIALLWPWTSHRYFFPWRLIPVAPLGADLLSSRGLRVLAWEIVAFSPGWVLALWPHAYPGGRPSRWRVSAAGAACALLCLGAFALSGPDNGTVLGVPCAVVLGVAAALSLSRFGPKARPFVAPLLGSLAMAVGLATTIGLDFALGDPIHVSDNPAARTHFWIGFFLGAYAFVWLWRTTVPIGIVGGWLLARWIAERS